MPPSSALRDRVRRVVLLGPTHRLCVDGLALPGVGAFETPLGQGAGRDRRPGAARPATPSSSTARPRTPSSTRSRCICPSSRSSSTSSPSSRSPSGGRPRPPSPTSSTPCGAGPRRCHRQQRPVALPALRGGRGDRPRDGPGDAPARRVAHPRPGVRGDPGQRAARLRPAARAASRGCSGCATPATPPGTDEGWWGMPRWPSRARPGLNRPSPGTCRPTRAPALLASPGGSIESALLPGVAAGAGARRRRGWLHRRGCLLRHPDDRHGQLRGCIGSVVPRPAPAAPTSSPTRVPRRSATGGSGRSPAQSSPTRRSRSPCCPRSRRCAVADEADALARLRPGVDGVVLELGERRATFLPQVWAKVPIPAAFLAHLKAKAGLPRGPTGATRCG